MAAPPPPPPPIPTGSLGAYSKAVQTGAAATVGYEQQFQDWANGYKQFNFTKLHRQLNTKDSRTRATYYSDDGSQQSKRELSLWARTWDGVSEGFIVIEDLNLEWLLALNNEFSVDQDFFRHHIVMAQAQLPDELHIDCEFRAINKTSRFGNVIETSGSLVSVPKARLSCRALRPGLYVLLVSLAQEPVNPMPPKAFEYEVTLSPSCNNPPAKLNISVHNESEEYHDATGGFHPQLFLRAVTNAMFINMQSTGFLGHLNWDVQKQSPTSHKVINNGTADVALCWMLTIYMWRANLSAVDHIIEELSYQSVVEPTRKTLNELAALRKAIADTRTQIARTKQDVPMNSLRIYDGNVQAAAKADPTRKVKTAADLFDNLNRRLAGIKETLNDSTQFLIGSITVNDADLSLKQANEANNMARRATALTVLAAIYLPLSFVTSMFGMNIAQLDPTPQWWVSLIALAVVLPPTAAFVAYALRSKKVKILPDTSAFDVPWAQNGITGSWKRWTEKQSTSGSLQTPGNIV